MKTKLFERIHRPFVAGLLLATVALSAGCVVVAAGAGAGAVAYVRGQLEATLDADFQKSVEATNRAIQQLQYAKVSEHKDALVDTFVARNADDKKIEIRLETVSAHTTKVRIRVGVFGNQPTSVAILEKIKSNL
jgi:hypothetical protein